MEKMYSINGALSRKRNMPSPNKESVFHGVFNALNVVWEQFTKVPSLIASINYPLSVTIVNNEGHVPQDILKNLTTKLEPLATDNMFIHVKESLNIVESIHNNMLDEKKQPCLNGIFTRDTESGLRLSSEYISDHNKDKKGSDDKEESLEENTCKSDYIYSLLNNEFRTCEEESFEYICPESRTEESLSTESNEKYCYSKITFNEQSPNNSTDNNEAVKIVSTSGSKMQTTRQATVSNMITNMIQKVFGGDRTCGTDSTESDTVTRRSSGSPKQRKKLNTVASGRGRGRGKSQLRRSGVSQTRHRKERTKHDIAADIETELRCWQELDIYDDTDTTESEDCLNFNEDAADTLQYVMEESVSPVTYIFSLDDVKSKKVQKSKTCSRNTEQKTKYCGKMKNMIDEYVEETKCFDFDFVENRNNVCTRSRLMSESSIDSEDSYCIVFEDSSCIVFETDSEVTYSSDLEDGEESDTESSNDEETCKDRGCVSPVAKVKFDLNPVVHVMVQWDYAYRAARKGPWEEMARDRERFRGRINCIEGVLNPILTSQHRHHIWQERFAANQ